MKPRAQLGVAKTGRRRFAAALRFRGLTRFYDPLARWFISDVRRKRLLVAQASLRDGERVLDLGGGTGTLALLLLESFPSMRVADVDVDVEMLAQARSKAAGDPRAWLVAASGDSLPFRAAAFDRAFSTLALHHLTHATKQGALAELRRSLRQGGWFHLLDFGPPAGALMWLLSQPGRLFDGVAATADNFGGRLPAMIVEAGFAAPEELAREASLFGSLVYQRARRP